MNLHQSTTPALLAFCGAGNCTHIDLDKTVEIYCQLRTFAIFVTELVTNALVEIIDLSVMDYYSSEFHELHFNFEM